MPASSVSSMNSWGIYIVSSLALVLVLAPQLTSLASDSRKAADWRNMDGVRAVLDSLQPGVVVNVAFGSPLPSDPLLLGGHQITCGFGSGTLSLPSRWTLANATLYPSVHYLARLEEGKVVVTRAG